MQTNAVIHQLKNVNPEHRKKAIRAIARTADPALIRYVQLAARKDPDEGVRKLAARAKRYLQKQAGIKIEPEVEAFVPNPTGANNLVQLAQIRQSQNRQSEAREHLKQALKLNPELRYDSYYRSLTEIVTGEHYERTIRTFIREAAPTEEWTIRQLIKSNEALSDEKQTGRIFLSYSRREFYFAESLALNLQKKSIPLWFDVWALAPGIEWEIDIKNGLDTCDALVLIASSASLASPYVQREWKHALRNRKPVYIALFENVKLPEALQHSATIIDFRAKFERGVDLLAEAIETKNNLFLDKDTKKALRYPAPVLALSWMMFSIFIVWWFSLSVALSELRYLLDGTTWFTLPEIVLDMPILDRFNVSTPGRIGILFFLMLSLVASASVNLAFVKFIRRKLSYKDMNYLFLSTFFMLTMTILVPDTIIYKPGLVLISVILLITSKKFLKNPDIIRRFATHDVPQQIRIMMNMQQLPDSLNVRVIADTSNPPTATVLHFYKDVILELLTRYQDKTMTVKDWFVFQQIQKTNYLVARDPHFHHGYVSGLHVTRAYRNLQKALTKNEFSVQPQLKRDKRLVYRMHYLPEAYKTTLQIRPILEQIGFAHAKTREEMIDLHVVLLTRSIKLAQVKKLASQHKNIIFILVHNLADIDSLSSVLEKQLVDFRNPNISYLRTFFQYLITSDTSYRSALALNILPIDLARNTQQTASRVEAVRSAQSAVMNLGNAGIFSIIRWLPRLLSTIWHLIARNKREGLCIIVILLIVLIFQPEIADDLPAIGITLFALYIIGKQVYRYYRNTIDESLDRSEIFLLRLSDWSSNFVTGVVKRKVMNYMTWDMVMLTLGEPDKRMTSSRRKHEQWLYRPHLFSRNVTCILFKDGKVKKQWSGRPLSREQLEKML